MGIFDRAKDTSSGQRQQLDTAFEQAGDFADEKIEGKYGEQVDKGQDTAKDRLGEMTGDEPEQPA
jgi:MT0933-like antitoxin protein